MTRMPVSGPGLFHPFLYARPTKIWMKRYGTGSGSDRVVLWDARSTPRPVATAPGTVPARPSVHSTSWCAPHIDNEQGKHFPFSILHFSFVIGEEHLRQ